MSHIHQVPLRSVGGGTTKVLPSFLSLPLALAICLLGQAAPHGAWEVPIHSKVTATTGGQRTGGPVWEMYKRRIRKKEIADNKKVAIVSGEQEADLVVVETC